MRLGKLLGVSTVLAAAMATGAHANLVTNGGFEGGVYTSMIGGNTNTSVPNGWAPNAGFNLEPPFNNVRTSPVNSGSYALSIGNYDYQPAPVLSQTLTDVAGTIYAGSLFVLYGGAGGGDSGAFFDVQINGTDVLALDDTAPGSYTEYTFSFTGTGSDTLALTGNTNPSEWFVDDVVVGGSSPVPEPVSLLLFGPACLAVGLLRRRRSAPL